MKDNKTKPVQVILTYKASNSEKESVQTKLITPVNKPEKKLVKLDDNHKLARRYSFDDNGGGYLGL